MHDYSFYSAILGLSTRWRISNVTVEPRTGTIELHINATEGNTYRCSDCGTQLYPKGFCKTRGLHNFNQSISLYISALVPKVTCSRCGEVNVKLPWESSSLRCHEEMTMKTGDTAPSQIPHVVHS
jgi:predicted RNA-binding Zn-ribbon protein involved in translation (DUF1610 family)